MFYLNQSQIKIVKILQDCPKTDGFSVQCG